MAYPKLLLISFDNPNATSEAGQRAAWERAHAIATQPGLIWKLWIRQPNTDRYGGLYLFENEASAEAYLDSEIVAGIRAIPGSANFAIQWFDVNTQLSAITGQPIPAPGS